MNGPQSIPSTPGAVSDSSDVAVQCVRTGTLSVSSHPPAPVDATSGVRRSSSTSDPPSRGSGESLRVPNHPLSGQEQESGRPQKGDEGGRLRVAKAITAVAEYIGTASPERFDYSAFQHGNASDFPEIPGEEQRNSGLERIRRSYNQPRNAEADDAQTPRRSRSRAVSFNGSSASRPTLEGGLTKARTISHQGLRSSLGEDTTKFTPEHPPTDRLGAASRQRSDTLHIPTMSHAPTRDVVLSQDPESSTTAALSATPPVIVVSDVEGPLSLAGSLDLLIDRYI